MTADTPAPAAYPVQWIAIDRLLTLQRNPQYQSSHQVAALQASMVRDGFYAPVLVRPRGDQYEIVSGNHRVQAARDVGLTSLAGRCRDLRACRCGDGLHIGQDHADYRLGRGAHMEAPPSSERAPGGEAVRDGILVADAGPRDAGHLSHPRDAERRSVVATREMHATTLAQAGGHARAKRRALRPGQQRGNPLPAKPEHGQ